MKHNSKTFCMHPFTGLATREDGAIKACCRSLPVAFIQNEDIESAWNNATMRRIRKQVLSNERPRECEPCFNLEDQGVESLRQRHIKNTIPESRINLYPSAVDQMRDDCTMPFEIPTIEIKTNNLCNLKCRMCNPLDSTNWKDWNKVVGFYKKENNYLVRTVEEMVDIPGKYIGPFDDNPNWWRSFEKMLPHFKRVEFAGGEPLMDPNHYKILDMLKPYGHQIELKYATNGTTLGIGKGRTIHNYWPHFKSIAVNVSIDGIHEVYEYIRSGSKFSDVEYNIQEMQKISNVSRIVGAFTAQAGNILQAAECIRYFTNVLGIVFYSHRVQYPKVLSAQVLPAELKEIAIRRLLDVKSEIDTFENVIKYPILRNILHRQVDDNINFLRANDSSGRWKDFVEFNRELDMSRGQGPLEKAIPEFIGYV